MKKEPTWVSLESAWIEESFDTPDRSLVLIFLEKMCLVMVSVEDDCLSDDDGVHIFSRG